MDETSLSTVQDGQRKITAEKGKKQVWILSSSQRGESSPYVVCVSATASYIPPMIIYDAGGRLQPVLHRQVGSHSAVDYRQPAAAY